ncbi:MAG: PEGA domain-containing protein [FCB group bacterium]|nr:PEGA domain-containing protein [FCB group bacterium]
MKKKIIFFLVLLILLFAGAAVKNLLFNKQAKEGTLSVSASPEATVFANSQLIGKTPFKDKLKVGEYIIKLIPEGEATATASWTGKVRINRRTVSYVNMELGSSDISTAGEVFTVTKMESKPKKANRGQLFVRTDPVGAIVYLDNDEKGISPLALENVPSGEHELSVVMPGFFRRVQSINIDSGYKLEAMFKLAIDKSQKINADTSGKEGSEASSSATTKKTAEKSKQVLIKKTPTGWLRVRADASLSASESARVNPGDKFKYLEEKSGWYKIEYEKGKTGWISSNYAKIIKE